jgi:hypothetical protein
MPPPELLQVGIIIPPWLAAIFGSSFMLLIGILGFFLRRLILNQDVTSDAMIKFATILEEHTKQCKTTHTVVDTRLNSHSKGITDLKLDVTRLKVLAKDDR